MAFNYPYGDTQQLNLNWFLAQWETFREQWATAEEGIDHALDAEIARVEAAMTDLYAARDAAAASKTAAQTAATNAASSATVATQQATLAQSYANTAQTQAGIATAAAEAAGNSASSASTSATAANLSKTQAANSATAAQTAQTAAEAAETNIVSIITDAIQDAADAAAATATADAEAAADAAEASATAAAGSASDASDSATAAAGSASDAADSATAAAGSATAAAGSATAAAGSASDAADSATAAAASAASIVVDSAMSDSSTNPVQNKVINGEITELKTALTPIAKEIRRYSFSYSNTDAYQSDVTEIYINAGESVTIDVTNVTSASCNIPDGGSMSLAPAGTYTFTPTASGYLRLYHKVLDCTIVYSDYRVTSTSGTSDYLIASQKLVKDTTDPLAAVTSYFDSKLFGENLIQYVEEGVYYTRGVKGTSAALTTAWVKVDGISTINASGLKLSNSTWSGVEMYYVNGYDENKNYITDAFDNSGAKQFNVFANAYWLAIAYVNTTYSDFTVVAGTTRPSRYVHNYQKTFLNPTNTAKWYGKTWGAMGDSLTEFNSRATENYVDYIVKETGIEAINYGAGGTGYRRGIDNSNAFYNRVSGIDTSIDVLTIFGSLNDIGGNQTLGTIDDTISDDTVFGYVNATLDALFTTFPGVKLGIISPTPWKDSEPWDETNTATVYSNGLKQICYNRGIPFLDLYHNSGLRPWDSDFRELFYKHDVVDGVNAGCHPDEDGHKMIYPRIRAFIDTLI